MGDVGGRERVEVGGCVEGCARGSDVLVEHFGLQRGNFLRVVIGRGHSDVTAGGRQSAKLGVPAGNVNRSNAPPLAVCSTPIVPPCASTIPFAM